MILPDWTSLHSTLLGQHWADRVVVGGWRLQENAVTGACRVLDPAGGLAACGGAAACAARLPAEPFPSGSRAVLVLHGIGRARGCMRAVSGALAAEGWVVADPTYPALLRDLDAVCAQMDGVLGALADRGVAEVSFAAHSLGSLVVRRLLERPAAWRGRLAVGRAVLLGPPSRGALMASWCERVPAVAWRPATWPVLLPAGAAGLPPPGCEFAVVAGGTGTRLGFNPLLGADNDGVVRVDETRLPGESGFRLVRRTHNGMLHDPGVAAAAVRFLSSGTL